MTAEALPQELRELVDQARTARNSAHAPYSGFLVGAALRAPGNRIFTGCNVENATYGATLCAERVAIAGMVLGGLREIEAIAVFSEGEPLVTPCGICRQVLAEFAAPEALVLAASPTGFKLFSLGQLLPEPFVLRK